MVLNNIEKLLEKYENGETSLKEEQHLKNYFSQEVVAPHLEVYKPMFAYFFESKQEQFIKAIPLDLKSKRVKRSFNYKWIAVAAVVVLSLSVYYNTVFNSDLGTYNENQKELAYNEVVKSLEMISSKFNKGASTVNYLNEVNKGTSTLGYLNEIENTTGIIFKTN